MITKNNINSIVKLMADSILRNENYFSELDAVVGDGDFGYSLARGFEKVLSEWENFDLHQPGNFLKQIAQIITSSVGGVSGAIWGTAFLRAGITLGNKNEISKEDVITILRSAIEGIKKRGNCDLGDKTYIDTLVPMVNSLEKSFNDGKSTKSALEIAANVAVESAEATRQLIAKRGRASYTGERSIGSLDAGSIAVATIMRDISSAWKE